MSKSVAAIRSVKARGLVVPIARPVKTAFATIDAAPMVLIDVETDQGATGRSYIFAYAGLTVKPLVHLIEEIGRELIGRPVAPADLMAAMNAKFRLLGWQGLVGMAVSGLDMAYWDALGQIANFAQQHQADQKLADKDRKSYTLLLAMRNWEFEAFAALRR